MAVDLWWLAKPPVLAKCRWDEEHAEQIIKGWAKRVAGQPDIVDHGPVDELPSGGPGGIVCFPAGAHEPRVAHWLNKQIAKLPWVVLFLTSDECQQFPSESLAHRQMDMWVQLPRPDKHYRQGTTFIGEGAPPFKRTDFQHKPFDWFFAGQNNHVRRQAIIDEMRTWDQETGTLDVTDRFLGGAPRESYLVEMARSKVVPAPAGACSQSSFRAFEALEQGCVPLLDRLRSDGQGDGYWEMVIPELVAPEFEYIDTDEARELLTYALTQWPGTAVITHSAWHGARRRYCQTLTRQLAARGAVDFKDTITVIIPSSTIPSHPDTSMIEETVASVRQQLPDAEILITCDGLPRRHLGRKPDYDEYKRRLCLLAEQWGNVTPVVHPDHLHQATMLKDVIQRVDSEYVLYVEHDTPLVNEPDFAAVLRAMNRYQLNVMRFYHEKHIHEDHERYMRHFEGLPWVGTLQWSQRPHLARTSFYRDICARFFGSGAVTFIEDVLYGAVEHDLFTVGIDDAHQKWRLALWAPPGVDHMNFSTHLDGRAGEPKGPMKFRYPKGVVPPGAPWRDIP